MHPPKQGARPAPTARRSASKPRARAANGAPDSPRPKKRRGKWTIPRSAWIGGAIAVTLLVAFGSAITSMVLFARRAGPGDGQTFIVDVAPDATSPSELAHTLAEAGLVSDERMMSLYLRLSTIGDVVPGEHLLSGGSTPSELASCLTRSTSRKGAKLTIPEGWNRFAIAERLEKLGITSKASFLRDSADPRILEELEIPAPRLTDPASPVPRGPESAEGYLFPATYELKLDTPSKEVLARLVRAANERWAKLAGAHAAALADLEKTLGWSRAEIITLASIIEKEAAVDDERAIIGSVFLNRLRDAEFTPHLLQSDPTSGYGCLVDRDLVPSCATYDGKITGAMNRDKLNRYSTYVNEGLPPGPISNPGERAILGVLEPATTKFLYFVAIGGGRHKFSETYDEHKKAIK